MKAKTLQFDKPVTLVGGGALDRQALLSALAVAPVLVAADGAADHVAAMGHSPSAIVGDMDSLTDPNIWSERATLIHLAEQDTTDFEKCLYSIEAPHFLAVGFTGGRMDHTLAVLHGMLRSPESTVTLLGEKEAMAFLPAEREINLDIEVGDTISLFPVLSARGVASSGLEWPITGLEFAPGRQIGTSNRAIASQVRVHVDGVGVLLMMPRDRLIALLAGVHGV